MYLNSGSRYRLSRTKNPHFAKAPFLHIKNIYLLDKKSIVRNKVRVIKRFEQTSSAANRYDVTILVNRLLLVKN
jgi:type I site-specific restriction-modification system R (restriction) subunit